MNRAAVLSTLHDRDPVRAERGDAVTSAMTDGPPTGGRAGTKPFLIVSELEDYTIAFANGLAQVVPVTLAVPRRRYAGLAEWFGPGVELHLLDWPRHRSPANAMFLFALNRLVGKTRPSVIHLLCNTTLWLNLAVPFWRPVPIVTTVHDVVTHPGDRDTQVLPEWSRDLIVRQSGDVVVHGETLKGEAVRRFGKAPDRVHVLSHPVIGRYAELARRRGLVRRSGREFSVLLFGRIFAYKGLEQLVRAEALLGNRIPGLSVVIAGRGEDPWALRPQMGDPSRYDVRNRFIEDEEVAQLFLDADVVALPYAEASQSGVLNVAAAFGKPMIATAVGELPGTIGGNRMGLVVPAGDPERLADGLTMLAGDPELRAMFGSNALRWAQGANAPLAVGRAAADLYAHIQARARDRSSERMNRGE